MIKHKIIISKIVIIISILLAGCVNKEVPVLYANQTEISNNTKVYVALDKTTFKVGENIDIPVVILNNGTNPILLKEVIIDINVSLPKGSMTNNVEVELLHTYVKKIIYSGSSMSEQIKLDQSFTVDSKLFKIESGIYNLNTSVKLNTSKRLATNLSASDFSINTFNIKPISIEIE